MTDTKALSVEPGGWRAFNGNYIRGPRNHTFSTSPAIRLFYSPKVCCIFAFLISISSIHHTSQCQANTDFFRFWDPNIFLLWLYAIDSWVMKTAKLTTLTAAEFCTSSPHISSPTSKRPKGICYNSPKSSIKE